MRLIDADIAINILNESIAINRTDVAMGLRLAMYEIDMLPTIDAVPVVQCKDCKHSTREQIGYGCEMNYRLATNGKFFCADGERKDDE